MNPFRLENGVDRYQQPHGVRPRITGTTYFGRFFIDIEACSLSVQTRHLRSARSSLRVLFKKSSAGCRLTVSYSWIAAAGGSEALERANERNRKLSTLDLTTSCPFVRAVKEFQDGPDKTGLPLGCGLRGDLLRRSPLSLRHGSQRLLTVQHPFTRLRRELKLP